MATPPVWELFARDHSAVTLHQIGHSAAAAAKVDALTMLARTVKALTVGLWSRSKAPR